MPLLDFLNQLIHPAAAHLEPVVVPADHVSPALSDTAAVAANQSYCFTIFAVNDAGRSPGGGDCVTIQPMAQGMTSDLR